MKVRVKHIKTALKRTGLAQPIVKALERYSNIFSIKIQFTNKSDIKKNSIDLHYTREYINLRKKQFTIEKVLKEFTWNYLKKIDIYEYIYCQYQCHP